MTNLKYFNSNYYNKLCKNFKNIYDNKYNEVFNTIHKFVGCSKLHKMSVPNSSHILRLYKDLLRYGQSLQLTDKLYFRSKIVNEFKKNKSLENTKDISFNFEKGKSLLKKGRVV